MVELAQVPVDRAKQLDLIRKRAAQSTLVLDLGDNDVRLPSSFVTTAFSSRYRVRVIALARSYEIAAEALGERYVRQMQHVPLRPIASRPEAVDRLLDKMFLQRSSGLRVSDMTPENQSALRAHRWPEQLCIAPRGGRSIGCDHALRIDPQGGAGTQDSPRNVLTTGIRRHCGYRIRSHPRRWRAEPASSWTAVSAYSVFRDCPACNPASSALMISDSLTTFSFHWKPLSLDSRFVHLLSWAYPDSA